MATNAEISPGRSGHWSEIACHDWGGEASIESTLVSALEQFDNRSDGDVLYDHLDLDAATEALSPCADRGATEVRFRYGVHEVRIHRDGTITAR